MFPFAVEPDPGDDAPESSRTDARGPDTVNRILLHGARHHDREALFLHWGQGREGWGWQPTPDWRADRAAIRVALVLHGRLEIGVGDRVAVWMPLGPEWAQIERGVWSLGATSIPVWPEWPTERVAGILDDSRPDVLFAPSLAAVRELEAIGGRPDGLRAVVPRKAPEAQGEDWLSLAKFLEYGGVQDTPERASMWRTWARGVEPDVTASLEHGPVPNGLPGRAAVREVSQGQLLEWGDRLTRRFPPRRGGIRLLATERPALVARTLLVAGWADGVTTTAFSGARVAEERAAELGPDLVAAPGDDAESLVTVLADRSGGTEAAFLSIDDAPLDEATRRSVEVVNGAELIVTAGRSSDDPGRGEAASGTARDGLEKRAESA